MATITTTTRELDYAQFIHTYLYGTGNTVSGFENSMNRTECIMPSVNGDNSDFAEDVLTTYEGCKEPDPDCAYFSPGVAAESILDDTYPQGAVTVFEWLREDLHDIFPNEKLWPHLDALADTAARRYYEDLYDTLHDFAYDVTY